MSEDLAGLNAIVIGAAGGIGKAVVSELAEQGCNIWACVHNINDNLLEKYNLLEKKHSIRITPIEIELMDDKSIKMAIKNIIDEKIDIDILINAAGIGHLGLFGMTSMDEIRKIYQINLFAPMLIIQQVIRKMCKQRHGQIINISSTASHEIFGGNSIYGSTKSALNLFSQDIAVEYAKYGISINCVAPGLTDTKMSKIFEGDNPELPLKHTVIGRKIYPEEVAKVVVRILSPDMRLINGQVIYANGGA